MSLTATYAAATVKLACPPTGHSSVFTPTCYVRQARNQLVTATYAAATVKLACPTAGYIRQAQKKLLMATYVAATVKLACPPTGHSSDFTPTCYVGQARNQLWTTTYAATAVKLPCSPTGSNPETNRRMCMIHVLATIMTRVKQAQQTHTPTLFHSDPPHPCIHCCSASMPFCANVCQP